MKKMYKRILVTGRVQGVGFRYYTKRVAEGLGISGYVRNLPNGQQVEIIASFTEKWDNFLDKIKKGPAFSEVKKVEIEDLNGEDLKTLAIEEGFFEIRR
jgi:acylphosphatase